MRTCFAFLVTASLVAASATPANAQIAVLGINAGGSFATLETSDSELGDIGRRTGSVIAASISLGGGTLGFRPEVMLVQKGFEARTDDGDALFEVDYVEIPLLLVARFGAGPLRPAIYGGPAVGFERSCTISGTGLDLTATGDCDAPTIELERETTDVGAAFGAELGLRVGGVILVADGRYTVGLTNLDPEAAADEESKNRVFTLTGGIQIPIG